jgi:hypothetical protein
MLGFLGADNTVQYPVSRDDLCKKYPHVSFPVDLEKADLKSYGVVKIKEEPVPICDYRTEHVTERPVEFVDGAWVKSWDVQPLSLEHQQQLVSNQSWRVRQDRDQRLAACDWTQLADVKLDAQQQSDWKKYRQALRDVPSQGGFPWNVTWPTQP